MDSRAYGAQFARESAEVNLRRARVMITLVLVVRHNANTTPDTTVPTTPFPDHLPDSAVEAWLVLKEHAPVMLIGGLVLGAICSAVSYVATWGVWEIAHRMEVAKRARHIAAEKAKHAHS